MKAPHSRDDSQALPAQLLNTIRASEHLAYAILATDFKIVEVSPNLAAILQQHQIEKHLGNPITDLFPEFIGAEEGLEDLRRGREKAYRLENVARKATAESFIYISLQMMLLNTAEPDAGFWLSVENRTEVGRLHQKLIQQRNELRLEVHRRQQAEEALQRLNNELEQRVEQRTAELAAANEQLRLLEAAIVHTSDTVIITEAEPKDLSKAGIVYVNNAFTEVTGYTYKEIVGQTLQVFHGPNTDSIQLQKMRNALLDQQAVQAEIINYRKDGSEFWADMTVAPIYDDDDKLTHFVSIERDVTEKKKLEAALLQAQKMEAIGLLAGGIAHDFNNVLTVVVSYADLLLHRFAHDETITKYVHPIHIAGKRASDLTYQLLAFSRKQVLHPEIINLNDTIKEVDTMIRRPIGEDIELSLVLADDLWQIEADPGQLSQVIVNLAVNARDAMPQGGRFIIDTRNATLGEEEPHISPELPKGQYVCLKVSDNGKGMDERTLQRIFDPFFTTKEMGKGTGLGLATVYGIIAQSGGGIAVHSEVGVGTVFEIYLPRKHEKRPQKTSAGFTSELKTAGSATILLIEDDDAVRQLMEEGLRSRGFDVLIAENGAAALTLTQTHKGAIDLLLTDIVMPGMSGFELSQKIEERYPSVKTLYITGYTDTIIDRHGTLNRRAQIVQKPFTLETIFTRINRLLVQDD